MKIGTVILILILVLVAFGYLISQVIQAGQDLQALRARIAELEKQLEETTGQLNICREQVAACAGTIAGLQAQISSLEGRLARLTAEKNALQVQGKLTELLSSRLFLPISLLLVTVVTRVVHRRKPQPAWPIAEAAPPGAGWVRLSPQELQWIISLRRRK